MDVLLTHASLFPQQLQQVLQTLGRKVLTVLMAVVMPVVLWLGLGGVGRSKVTAIAAQEPLLNLIYVNLPAESYREVPQPTATSRRGLWEKCRPDWEREIQLVIGAEGKSFGVTALPFDLCNDLSDLRTNSHPYQTILPNLDWNQWLSVNNKANDEAL